MFLAERLRLMAEKGGGVSPFAVRQFKTVKEFDGT
jgi:hypothetical protein